MKTKQRSSRTAAPAADAGCGSPHGCPPEERSRQEQIATAAYYKAVARGFQAGGEIEDWLAAESEFEARQAFRS